MARAAGAAWPGARFSEVSTADGGMVWYGHFDVSADPANDGGVGAATAGPTEMANMAVTSPRNVIRTLDFRLMLGT
jgi:hypothetical protein